MNINVYLDVNPLTNKPFYVGIGSEHRCKLKPRKNIFHRKLIESFPNQEFERIIIYRDIPLEQAYKIEMQIIKKCGKLIDGSGYLANIHDGGPLESKSQFGHPYRGMKMKDLYGDDWEHPNKGKPYLYMYGPEERALVIELQKLRTKKTKETRLKLFGKSEKELLVGEKRKNRILEKGFTDNEKLAHKKISDRQRGLTMKERLNNPDWTHPLKGIKRPEGYTHPRFGKKLKDIKGSDYIDPKSKPFTIIINKSQVEYFASEIDFIERTKLTSPMLCKLKKNKTHTIKRQSNSIHPYKTGDTLQYVPMTIEQFQIERSVG